MKRRLLQFLFAVGLLLTLVAIVVFVRGFWASDRFEVSIVHGVAAFPPALDILIVHGSQRVCGFTWGSVRQRAHRPDATGSERFRARHRAGRAERFALLSRGEDTLWRRLGFGYAGATFANPMAWGIQDQSERSAIAPTWFLGLLGTTMMYPWFHTARRVRRRRDRCLCVICGYDLRGAEHERCPECGEPVIAAPRRV